MEKVAKWAASYFLLIPKYHSADQIKQNAVGRACGMHGRREESVQDFGGKAQRKETTQKTKAKMGRLDQNGS
jgi:hypothetical protein